MFGTFNDANSQYFSQYYTWASEKHVDPGTNDVRLPFIYKNILFALEGNFNGAITRNEVEIPSISYLMKVRNFPNMDTIFAIYTVESQGYRVLDPAFNYSSAAFVNAQEELELDVTGHIKFFSGFGKM